MAGQSQPGTSTALRLGVAAVLLLGAALRLWHWAGGRSLWVDEALLALNLRARGLGELLQPLAYEQAAPIGFLWLVKASTAVLGDGERALRLWPLCASLLGLPLCAALVRRLLTPWPALLALLWFALGDVAVYYAGECKQYSTDLLCALLVLHAWARAADPVPRGRAALGLALGGAVLVWLSHPAPLLLAAAGSVLALRALRHGGGPALLPWLGVIAVWLLAFALHWWVALGALHGDDYFKESWRPCFVPWRLAAIPGWLVRRVPELLREPGGFRWPWPYVALLLLGSWRLLRRDRATALLCLLPWAWLLLVGALHLYPVCIKFTLFLLPTLLVLLAAGLAQVVGLLPQPARRGGALLLTLAAVLDPLWVAAGHLATPRTVEELRPVLQALRSRHQPGDVFYLQDTAQYAWRYYAAEYGLPQDFEPAAFQPIAAAPAAPPVPRDPHLVVGVSARNQPERYATDAARLAGRGRVWLVMSHTGTTRDGRAEQEVVLAAFRAVATPGEVLSAPGAGAWLFTFP